MQMESAITDITGKPPELYFVYTTEQDQTNARPLLIDINILKTWYVEVHRDH